MHLRYMQKLRDAQVASWALQKIVWGVEDSPPCGHMLTPTQNTGEG